MADKKINRKSTSLTMCFPSEIGCMPVNSSINTIPRL